VLYPVLTGSSSLRDSRSRYFPLTLDFLQQRVEKEVLVPAEDKTLLSRTASAVQRRN
jgi:hypothetical protein